jgi:hypothetical protein
MDETPKWAAKLAADAKRMLDDLKSGMELHKQINSALNGVKAQPHMDQGEQE